MSSSVMSSSQRTAPGSPEVKKGGVFPNRLEIRGVSTTHTYSESKESESEKDSSFTLNRQRGFRTWESFSCAETQNINTLSEKKTLKTIMDMAGKVLKNQRGRDVTAALRSW